MQRVNIISTRHHTYYRTFSLILAWFGGDLQQFTTRYRWTYLKKVYKYFFKKLRATHGNLLQIVMVMHCIIAYPC